jgi:hypothetical protein
MKYLRRKQMVVASWMEKVFFETDCGGGEEGDKKEVLLVRILVFIV